MNRRCQWDRAFTEIRPSLRKGHLMAASGFQGLKLRYPDISIVAGSKRRDSISSMENISIKHQLCNIRGKIVNLGHYLQIEAQKLICQEIWVLIRISISTSMIYHRFKNLNFSKIPILFKVAKILLKISLDRKIEKLLPRPKIVPDLTFERILHQLKKGWI